MPRALAYLSAGGEVNADGRFSPILFAPRASGGGGIRTRGPRERTPVFKTGAFARSAPPPAPTVCPMPEPVAPLLVVHRAPAAAPAAAPGLERARLVGRARLL